MTLFSDSKNRLMFKYDYKSTVLTREEENDAGSRSPDKVYSAQHVTVIMDIRDY